MALKETWRKIVLIILVECSGEQWLPALFGTSSCCCCGQTSARKRCNVVRRLKKKVNAFFPPLVCLSPHQLHTVTSNFWEGICFSREGVSECTSVVELKGELSVWACSLVLCYIGFCLSQLCLCCSRMHFLWEIIMLRVLYRGWWFSFFFLPVTAQFVDQNKQVFFCCREEKHHLRGCVDVTLECNSVRLLLKQVVWRQHLSPLTETKRHALAACYALFSRNVAVDNWQEAKMQKLSSYCAGIQRALQNPFWKSARGAEPPAEAPVASSLLDGPWSVSVLLVPAKRKKMKGI